MRRSIAFCLFWLSVICLSAQPASLLELMRSDTAIDLYLTLNWRELEKKKADKAYLPAHAMFRTINGDTISLEIKARARGNRRLEICSYAPLKIKFDKNELVKLLYKPHNEMDVVHHCHKGDQFDQYIFREYLAYKLYQELSPYSYQVQLVRLHYLNPDGTVANEPSIGFLVENTEELADRVGAKRVKVPVISKNAIDRMTLLKVCIFQYMIGNTDWYITNRHNLEFIGVPGIPFLVTVPYDFDYSGLVGTPYGTHHESLKLVSTTIRYYQGKCETEEDVHNTLKEFIAKKERLLTMAREIPGMDERSIKYVVDYLEEFFAIIENPKKVEYNILHHCDRWPREK